MGANYNSDYSDCTVNIELIRKKDSSASINFDCNFAQSGEYLSVLGAEKINYLNVRGRAYRKNGMPSAEYTITAEFTAKCARCNKEAPQTIKARGEKYIADKSDGKDDSGDYYVTETEGIINMSDFTKEFLGLEVPIRYLCSENCRGLCPKCGKDLNDGECSCPKKEKNPDFAVLDDFFK